MTQINLQDPDEARNKSTFRDKIIKRLKFYLIPGYRDPEFSAMEYEIGKIKSKRKLFRRFLTPLTILGFILILFIVILAVYAPWISLYPLQKITPPFYPGTLGFQPPSADHPLGTTKFGYDLLARLIWGSRTTIQAAFIPVFISVAGGVILGTISAYFGGWLDYIMMRIVDVMFTIPMLILIIIIAPLIGRDLYSILIIYGLLFIPYNIRFMRSLVLQVKQNIYVRAAVTSGADKVRVMFKHIFPNAFSPIIISFFGGMGGTVLGLAGLAFIGMGDPTIADWGTDIIYAKTVLLNSPGAALWPGLFIGITVIGFMLIGDGLRDALDPRLHI